ncbi:MAG TPA: septal ring lytic transglycosylase RlpA family protein [Holophaga sp.]|nr:septal ring lytic transglycosylase RlpA family protein [Holophaga sp.]
MGAFPPSTRTWGAALGVAVLLGLGCARPRALPSASPLEAGGVFEEVGVASWYGGDDGFAGRPTANGERFDPRELTCAHRTLPFDTRVEVKNLGSGETVILRVNDRGPYARGRVLDVSERAARALGMHAAGTARVRIRSVDARGNPAPVDPEVLRGNPYTIQVAALADPEGIRRLSQEVRDLGPVSLQEVPGRGVKRVRVGAFARLEDAQRAALVLARRLEGRGLDPFVTRVR